MDLFCYLLPAYSGDYCDTEVFRGECDQGQVIMIKQALYGRMRMGRCVSQDMGYIGCNQSVLEMADRMCSGRSVCEIRVPNAEFESTRVCMKELRSYLSISYGCLSGEKGRRRIHVWYGLISIFITSCCLPQWNL